MQEQPLESAFIKILNTENNDSKFKIIENLRIEPGNPVLHEVEA